MQTNVPKMNINNELNYEIEPAPQILELDDHEKFKGSNGKLLDIEVRGERHPKKCYFKVSDVSKEFEILSLDTTLLHQDRGYEKDKHYKNFTINKVDNEQVILSKTPLKKALFLTYSGMIRVLFCSRNKNAELFQEWATEKLFTLQLGTNDMKDELVSELKGITTKTVKSMFAKTGTFPCIYLYKLNNVKEIRESSIFKLKDDLLEDTIICKYGQTEYFERRTKEHERDYSKMKSVIMELVSFAYIDPKYVYEAETDIRSFFNDFGMKVEIEGRSEIVAIPNNLLKQVKQKYENLGTMYAGRNTEMIIQLKEWKNKYELLKENHINEINTLKLTFQLKEQIFNTEIQKHKLEIQLRDERISSMEKIRDLEHKLLESKGIIF